MADSFQNRKELKRKANSVSLLRSCLCPSSLHVMTSCHPNRRLLEACPAFIAASHDARTPLLLYPRHGALSESDVASRAAAGQRFALVVLDGNWTETADIARAFDEMTSFSLDVGKYKGLFSPRRPKQDGFLSTLEAVAYALDLLQVPFKPPSAQPQKRNVSCSQRPCPRCCCGPCCACACKKTSLLHRGAAA